MRETGTGQQVAQFHERLMMTMMILRKFIFPVNIKCNKIFCTSP